MPKRAEKYLEDVQKGRVLVGNYIKLAVKRHLNDLKKSKRRDFPYFFSRTHAQGAIESVEVQRLAFGSKSGEPFVLQPWQAFVLYLLYGWRKKKGGNRRFVKAIVKVARGNAKTEFAAAIANIGLLFEPMRDPQVFWVATKKDQAKIGFDRQKTMVEYMRQDYPEVAEAVDTSKYSIYEKTGAGSVKYLGKDFHGEDGFSPFYVIGDEYHAWRNDDLMHVMESGLIKRETSLTFIITTAGNNPDGPCEQLVKHAKSILKGDVVNEALLAIIYELDEGDDWQDRTVWPKPNPGLGVTVMLEGIEDEFRKAKAEGVVKADNFRCKNLNITVASRRSWIPDETFKACGKKFDPEILDGKLCFGGLDLSKTQDITALALFFPSTNEKEPHRALFKFWVPEDTADVRTKLDGIPYHQWRKDGWLTYTDGDTINYSTVKEGVMEATRQYSFHSCAFDRWAKQQMVFDIIDEMGVVETESKNFMEQFAQTVGVFTAPLIELDTMVRQKKLAHGGNPVIEWMNRNVMIWSDGNGNFKISKKKNNSEKVDGMVALAMAIGQWMTYKHKFQEAYSSLDVFAL